MKLTERKIGILVLASPLQGRRYMCGFLGNRHFSQFFVAVFLLAGLFVTVTHSLATETEADSENPFIYSLTERQNKFLAGAQLGCFYDEALGKSYFIEIARGDLADGVFTLRTIKARRLRGELRNKTKSLASAPSKRLRREVAFLREQITLWQNCRTWAGPGSGAPTEEEEPPISDGPGSTPRPTPSSTPEESPSPAPTTTLAPTPLPTVSPSLVPSPTLSPSPSATPTPVATPTAVPTPTVAPSPSPTATPVQTATSLTHGGVTWTFSSARPVGQYVDGSYWVMAPVTITSISPAFNGTSNGSMLNPRPIPAGNGVVYSGYDTRGNYDVNLRVQTPVSYSNNGQIRSLVSTIGNSNPSAALDPYGAVSGSYIREMRVLTIVPSVPAQDAFRPNYLGLTKFQFRLSDMNLEVFNLGLDANRYAGQIPSAAMVNQMITGGTWGILSGSWGDRYLRPSQSSPGYGQYFARMIGDLGLYILHDQLPHREAVIRALLQYGIDVAGGVAESSTLFSRDGGQTNGHKLPLYLVAHALPSGEVKNLLALILATHPFSENGQIVGGTPFYTPHSGFSFAGFSATGAVEQQHPSTYTAGMFHAQRYKYCCTLTIFGGPWLVVSLLDGWDLWGSEPFRHYVWGYFEVENLNAQASLIDQNINLYNSTVPPNQQIGTFGTWFIDPLTGHGEHDSSFVERVWSHEADMYYP